MQEKIIFLKNHLLKAENMILNSTYKGKSILYTKQSYKRRAEFEFKIY